MKWDWADAWTAPILFIPISVSLPISALTIYSFSVIRWQNCRRKAGIIKENTPIIIGETTPETKPVFIERAQSVHAPILFAEEEHLLQSSSVNETGERIYQTTDFAELKGELGGLCQLKNTNTLLSSIRQLKR